MSNGPTFVILTSFLLNFQGCCRMNGYECMISTNKICLQNYVKIAKPEKAYFYFGPDSINR